MWHLELDRILPLLSGPPAELAVETGTCRGNGARALAKRFPRVVTIDLSEELYRLASHRLQSEGLWHVECLLGNSEEHLQRFLPSLPPSQPVFFFLDAHWSGDDSVHWRPEGWRGYGINTSHLGKDGNSPAPSEQCPLAGELAAIVKHCLGPAYVLIDDMKNIPARGPGLKDHTFPGEDWSHLSRDLLLGIVRPRLEAMHELAGPEQWLLALKPLC